MNAFYRFTCLGSRSSLPLRAVLFAIFSAAAGGTGLAQNGANTKLTPVVTISPSVGSVTLDWNSSPGLAYQVQSRSNLSAGTWETNATIIVSFVSQVPAERLLRL